MATSSAMARAKDASRTVSVAQRCVSTASGSVEGAGAVPASSSTTTWVSGRTPTAVHVRRPRRGWATDTMVASRREASHGASLYSTDELGTKTLRWSGTMTTASSPSDLPRPSRGAFPRSVSMRTTAASSFTFSACPPQSVAKVLSDAM